MAADSSWLDTMPEIYDRCLGPALFAPYASFMGAIAAAHAPRTVLEIAAGSGIVTAELILALSEADITATDLNPAMVDLGRGRVSGPIWLAADAQSLQFPDDAFDLVVCQFGVMFFPDKAAAFAEAARVLRPGGVFLATVWDRVELSPFPQALTAAMTTLFPDDPPDFVARIPHGYHDADRISADLIAGGLEPASIEHRVLRGSAASARTLAEGFCLGTPLRFALQERGDLEEITRAVAHEMTLLLGPDRVEGDLAAILISARRPER